MATETRTEAISASLPRRAFAERGVFFRFGDVKSKRNWGISGWPLCRLVRCERLPLATLGTAFPRLPSRVTLGTERTDPLTAGKINMDLHARGYRCARV